MAKQEIILKGLDGHEDHLVYDATNGQVGDSLEECARSLFPKEGETSPRLRFKGFEGEWVSTKLCEISKKVTTKNTDLKYKTTLTNSAEYGIINQLDFFDHDISNGDNIRGYFVVEPDDFVYNPRISVTAPVGPINRNQLGYAGIMSPLYYVFRVEGIDLDYLSYYFKTKLWHKFMYDNGNSGARFDRFSISDEVFGQMPILHPSEIEEQKAIAAFFHRLDSQIALRKNQYERLLQVKSACLETMFPKHSENTPPIRFKGFDGEWEKQKASKLFMTFNERNRPDLPVLSACQDIRGMAVRSESGYEISHDRSNEVTYKVVKPGQFVIHLRSFQGGFAHSAIEGITSPAYTVFGFKDPSLHDDYFWKTIFMSKSFVKRLETITYGIRDGRSISFEEFSNMVFSFPSSEEQHVIASFFKEINLRISIEQQQLERLKQMKSASLRSMFPQNGGGNLPLIRFKGYSGKWIKVKLSKYASRITRKNINMETTLPLTISAAEGLIEQTAFFNNVVASSDVSGYYLIKKGEFAYNKSSSASFPFGAVKKLDRYEKGVLSTLYIVFDVDRSISHDYLVYYFETSLWHQEISKRATEGARNHGLLNIGADSFLDIDILVPENIGEQRCIASFFRSLDTKISLQTKRIEKLKQMKSVCLSKMIA